MGRSGAKEPSIWLIPLRLDARGFPQVASRPEENRARDNQSREKIPATAGAAFSRNRVQRDSKKR
jgi:hypothetical protein